MSSQSQSLSDQSAKTSQDHTGTHLDSHHTGITNKPAEEARRQQKVVATSESTDKA